MWVGLQGASQGLFSRSHGGESPHFPLWHPEASTFSPVYLHH